MRHLSWLFVSVLGLTGVLSCGEDSEPLSPEEGDRAAALSQGGAGAIIPGRFIVTLREGATFSAISALARDHGVSPDFVYTHALNGFAGSISEPARQGLLRDPRVLRVEPDRVMTIFETQGGATWGLDRIDQHALPLDQSYTYNYTGTGVTAYIVDTGMRLDHVEFGGRALSGHDAVDGGSADDCNGHGTHVGGTVGGTTYGVAKDVRLVAVRVLDCGGSGTTSGVIAGIDWVTGDHAAGASAVANMSLGGGASASLDDAVKRSVADGVSYAIAAGNGNALGVAQDACNYSPARVPEAMTIGATSNTDTKTSWSNYGSCVDWFAPGASITAAWHTSSTATNTISGTSMATPHTAGVAALYLQHNPGTSPQQVREALYGFTTRGIVKQSNTANNHLLYSLESAGAPNSPPVAAFGSSCTGLSCSFTDQSTDSDGSVTGWSWNFGDGGVSTTPSPVHTYAAGGTYTVTLAVTDNGGATGQTSKSVTVTSAPPPNSPPTASFTYACTRLNCSFTDRSADSDGTVVSWSWTFGDGGTSTAQNPAHTYAAGGTYTVRLTVTDDGGASHAASKSVRARKGRNTSG